MSQVRLQLKSVVKSFGSARILRGLNLDVGQSELVCLIGASGSGKSTLLRCINLLETIDEGTIHFDGVEISDPEIDPRPIRQRIGIVFQSFNLFPHMTAAENVTLAPRRVLGRSNAELIKEAEHLFAKFGLLDRMKHYPDQLSGGQQQRVAIIRAFMMKPEVMLFDEVTSALDPELVGDVLDAIRALKKSGMTMVLATHEMGFAREAADKVCFLHEGVVHEEGPPSLMFSAPEKERTRAFLSRIVDAGRL